MAATTYGVIYLFTAALPDVYTESYAFTNMQNSLVFLAVAVGAMLSFAPRFYDRYLLQDHTNEAVEPEEKLFGFYVAAPVLAAGLWWFAATVPPLVQGVTFWSSIISLIPFGFSVVEFDYTLSGYLCDIYTSNAASATAPMGFLRAILSGTFPLFGSQMFSILGANIALFIIASIATAFVGVAVLFHSYGKRTRQRSSIAMDKACGG
ncbi:putative MFS transporter superfamily [Septoria linicola]|nr:putative MFS transporter superfamily [Septoria linicola]